MCNCDYWNVGWYYYSTFYSYCYINHVGRCGCKFGSSRMTTSCLWWSEIQPVKQRMTFTSHFRVCQFWRQACAILQYSVLIVTCADLGISWIIREMQEQLEKTSFTRCLCQGSVMDLPSNAATAKKTFWFPGPHTAHTGVISVLHTRLSSCSPFVSK